MTHSQSWLRRRAVDAVADAGAAASVATLPGATAGSEITTCPGAIDPGPRAVCTVLLPAAAAAAGGRSAPPPTSGVGVGVDSGIAKLAEGLPRRCSHARRSSA